MKTQSKYPDMAGRIKVRELFKEKIADPFNSAFGHITNNRGQQCFNIRVFEERDPHPHSPEDLAQGRTYPLEANTDDYKMSLFFYTNGQGCACLDYKEKPNRIDDSHEKILRIALMFIEAELENTGKFPDDLVKVKTAIVQLEKQETPQKPKAPPIGMVKEGSDKRRPRV